MIQGHQNDKTAQTTATPAKRGAEPVLVQPKLAINQPGDRYEVEADRVADAVMTMRGGDPPVVSRMAASAASAVQRQSGGEAGGVVAAPVVSEVLNSGGGRPLEADTQEFMESRFGQDFSKIKIHDGGRAAESAAAIQARAYTSGSDVVFNKGEYQPGSDAGRRLLAHELAHVGQQGHKLVKRQEMPGAAEDTEAESDVEIEIGDIEIITPPPPPVTPSFEVITATTASTTSTGDLTDRIVYNWRRRHLSYIDAAREAADRQLLGESVPTRSRSTDSEHFDPRWALYFGAWNYETGSDLSDVRANLRRGSGLQRALRGSFQQVNSVANPTGTQLREMPITTLESMAPLISDAPGELVIHFEGHGGADGICGVDTSSDDSCVGFSELREIANRGRDMGIHVTYILDTCNIGQAVQWAQAQELVDLDASAGPEEDRSASVESEIAFLRNMITPISSISGRIGFINSWRRRLPSIQTEAHEAATEMITQIDVMLQALSEDQFYSIAGSDSAVLHGRLTSVREIIERDNQSAIGRRALRRWRRALTPVFRKTSELINDRLGVLRMTIRLDRRRRSVLPADVDCVRPGRR